MRKKEPTTCSHAVTPPFGATLLGGGAGRTGASTSSIEPLTPPSLSVFPFSLIAAISISINQEIRKIVTHKYIAIRKSFDRINGLQWTRTTIRNARISVGTSSSLSKLSYGQASIGILRAAVAPEPTPGPQMGGGPMEKGSSFLTNCATRSSG